jgi:trigger factor
MEVTQTSSEGLKRQFKVVLPASDLASRLEGQLNDMRGKARINGFRPGKVPLAHLRKLYGRAVMADVVQAAVNEANRKIVEENSLRLATEPKLEFPEDKDAVEQALEARGDLAFTVDVEVLPKVEIGGFEDIAIERLVAEVPDAEVDGVIERLADQNRSFTPKEGEAAVATKGDKLTVDFVGTMSGEAFDGGTATDIDVVLGSNSFIPGFEEKLEGAKAGETRGFDITFPENYAAPKLAGQTAHFEVTVKAVASPGAVTLDDEFAKGFGFDDMAKLRESIRDNIQRDFTAASRAKWKRALLDALDKKYSFELPEGLVAQEFESVWRSVEADRAESGRSFEDEGTTEAAARADYRKIAERRVRLGLLLAEIGEKAEVKVADDELGRALMERARAYPGQEKQIWEYYTKNPDAMAQIRAPLYEEKVVDHIAALASVTERTVSKDELLAPLPDDEDKPKAA